MTLCCVISDQATGKAQSLFVFLLRARFALNKSPARIEISHNTRKNSGTSPNVNILHHKSTTDAFLSFKRVCKLVNASKMEILANFLEKTCFDCQSCRHVHLLVCRARTSSEIARGAIRTSPYLGQVKCKAFKL